MYSVVDEAKRRMESLNKFLRETNVSRIEDGSKGRALFEAIADQIEAVTAQSNSMISEANPETATGAHLMLWADFLGIGHEQGRKPFALAADENVELYVENGTFALLNEGNPITIPASSFKISGLTFRSSLTSDALPVEYELVEDLILDPSDSSVFLTVIGTIHGDDQNIEAGQLNDHNFEDYPAFNDIKIKVRNRHPITNGRHDETDEELRFKMSRVNYFKSSNATGPIESALQLVPGVTDVITEVGYSGSGSVDFFIDTAAFVIPNSLLLEASNRLDEFRSDGFEMYVNKVVRVGIYIDTTVKFKRGVAKDRQELLVKEIQAGILNSIINKPAGSTLNIADLYVSTLNSFPELSSLSKNEKTFDNVILYRDGFANKRHASPLIGSVVELKSFERLLPEEGLLKSVNIRRA